MKYLCLLQSILLLLISCSKSKDKQLNIDWDNINISTLPFHINYSGSLDVVLNVYDEIEKISKQDKIIKIFGGFSQVNERLYTGNGIDSTVTFYKRFPDVHGNKVILFAYLSQDDLDQYPAFELQTFDSINNCIDKIVVCSATFDECLWTRSFFIEQNYLITIQDYAICHEMAEETEEQPEIVFEREETYFYLINPEGYFVRYYQENETVIEECLKDDWNEENHALMIEKGEVKNHLREGLWQIIEKRSTQEGKYYVQGIGRYRLGLKEGEWIYLKQRDKDKFKDNEELTIVDGAFYLKGRLTHHIRDITYLENLIKKIDN